MRNWSPQILLRPLLLVTLTACAHTGWNRSGATQAELASDRMFCEVQANRYTLSGAGDPGYAILGVWLSNRQFNTCMEGLGWLDEESSSDVAAAPIESGAPDRLGQEVLRPSALAEGAGIEWEILNEEVMSLYQQGRYNRAVVVAEKALEIAEKNVGPNHPDVVTSLENMAELYRATDRQREAEKLEERAAAIRALSR